MRVVIAADPSIEVVRTYCEEPSVGLAALLAERADVEPVELEHLAARSTSEGAFFADACDSIPDRSNPVSVRRGAINDPDVVQAIRLLRPEVIAAFGCSLVGQDLIDAFPHRIVNLHLGLSPYYRGSATNLWPLVDGRPELVGATFMYLDSGIDTGQVIHQLRARIEPDDDVHRIGNRVIADAAVLYRAVLSRFDELAGGGRPGRGVAGSTGGGARHSAPPARRRADVTAATLRELHRNFDSGMIEAYLQDQADRDAAAPIVINPVVAG